MSAAPYAGALGTALLLSLALGCAAGAPEPSTAPAPAPEPVRGPTVAAIDTLPGVTGFDPAKWAPPETGPSPEAERVLATLPDPGRISLPADLPKTSRAAAPPPEAHPDRETCREVQIVATAERAKAEEASRTAAQRFGLPARVVPGGGLYRVRVGGCLGEGQSVVVRDTAKRLGYDGAFVVTSTE